MEADIPIDIHYNKLLDWLINRRHCPQQWQDLAVKVKEKINGAIEGMPPVQEITMLLQGSNINYFHCKRIVELLKDTDSGAKNIFGQYSSQQMKDWQEVLKLYEKDGVYLAEAAQILARNVNYEIPSFKKQIIRCQQAQRDCTKKEEEYLSSASELRENFSSSCKTMGIKGKKLKSELFGLVKDMPTTFDKVANMTKALDEVLNYYCSFVDFILKRDDVASDILPLTKLLKEKGNITTYEYRLGKAPKEVEDPLKKLSFEEEEDVKEVPDEELEIDWGGDAPENDNIDFGEGDIDWGDTEISIEVVSDSTANIDLNTSGAGDDIARGDDALTILDNPSLRSKFLDELTELEVFLSQRICEASTDGDVISSSLLQAAPLSVQINQEKIGHMHKSVQEVLNLLNSERVQELLFIRNSPRYLERLADKLHKKIDDSEKLKLRAQLMVTRRAEALEEEKVTEPRLDLLRQRTMELKKEIEVEISKKYQNRKVNIMGEINTI